MRTPIILAIIALMALAVFNPGMDQFETFVRAQSERILQQQMGDSALGRALSGAAGTIAGAYIDRITDRDNYIFFSIYTVDLDGPERDEEEWRFLGMAGQFLELEKPASLQEQQE